MHKFMFLVFAIFSFTTAKAEVSFSVEKNVSIETLNRITALLETAAQRPPEAQIFHSYFVIQNDLVLVCPPNLPNSDGGGCEISFRSATSPLNGDIGITIRKPVFKKLVEATLLAAKQETARVDPNTSEAHLHFANPLYTLPAGQFDGTHYYCKPEGEQGLKIWTCYLSVSETINRNPIK